MIGLGGEVVEVVMVFVAVEVVSTRGSLTGVAKECGLEREETWVVLVLMVCGVEDEVVAYCISQVMMLLIRPYVLVDIEVVLGGWIVARSAILLLTSAMVVVMAWVGMWLGISWTGV